MAASCEHGNDTSSSIKPVKVPRSEVRGVAWYACWRFSCRRCLMPFFKSGFRIQLSMTCHIVCRNLSRCENFEYKFLEVYCAFFILSGCNEYVIGR
jgi:hypothetical protein